MIVVRFENAPYYDAAGHRGAEMRRLQGMTASATSELWLGHTVLEPQGEIELSSSASEKLYVVLQGEVVISNGMETATLRPLDSCRIGPGEPRQLRNDSVDPASVLLAMPLPDKKDRS